MGARLTIAAARRPPARTRLLLPLALLLTGSCASSDASRSTPPTTQAATLPTTTTELVSTTSPSTSGAPTTLPPTTLAPTTTTVVPDPPEVPCAETPPRSRDVAAALDAEAVDVPADAVAPRPLPAVDFAVRSGNLPQEAARTEPDPAVRGVLDRLAAVPTSFSVGDWLGDAVTTAVAQVTSAAAGRVVVLQIYDLPHRDAGGGFSTGGAPDADAYRAFTAAVIAGIGSVPTVVILEPDSLGQMRALTPAQQGERYQLLNEAVDAYTALPNAWVYLDGTHCGWLSAELNAQRLLKAGVARAQGFFVNVGNYQTTESEVWRAHEMAQLTGGRHFVVDTGRSGNGPFPGQLTNRWCNPPGRALGAEPTRSTASRFADAYLWVKQPGASDGTCARGEPAAGTFWTERAMELARAAGW